MSTFYTAGIITTKILIDDLEIFSSEIISYKKLSNYITNKLPSITVKLNLPIAKYVKIMKLFNDSEDNYLNIYLKQNQVFEINEEGTTETDTTEVELVNDEFIALFSEIKDYVDDDLLNKYKVEEDKESFDLVNFKTLQLALYRKDDLTAFSKDIVHGIFNDSNLSTLISYGFQTCSNNSLKFVFSSLDNDIDFNSKVIRPMGFIDFINYLDSSYRLYESGYNIFIDDGVVYLINKDNNPKVEAEKYYEVQNIKIINASTTSFVKSVLEDDNGIPTYHIREESSIRTLPKISNIGNKALLDIYYKADDYEILKGDLTYTISTAINEYKKCSFNSHKDRELIQIEVDKFYFDLKPYTKFKLIGKRYNDEYRIQEHDIVIDQGVVNNKLTLYRVL